MFAHCKLVILILALTLDGRVHSGEIIRGHKADAHSRPYMAILYRHMEDKTIAYCDGFLVNEDFLMTAAHCQARSYTVILGVNDVHSSDKQTVSVKQSFPHKDFNSSDFTNDIMLLKLSSKVQFNNNVKPIALANQRGGSLPKSCIISGWGRANNISEYMSPILMEANVTLIENKQCAAENLYCSVGDPGPSQGDSGGPLVCEDGKAYGVVSFSLNETSTGKEIHAYTKVSDFKSWIHLTIRNAS